MAARPEVAAPVGPVPEGRVGRLVDPAVTHHPSPGILDGPVRQSLQSTHKRNSKMPKATGRSNQVLEEASFAATQHSVNMTVPASSKKLSCSRCAELQQHWLQ